MRILTLRGPSRELMSVGSLALPRPAWAPLPLGASFALAAAPYGPPQWYLDDLGFVSMRGVVQWTAGALPQVVGTLPVGSRPPLYQGLFAVTELTSGRTSQVTISTAGVVTLIATPGGWGDTISFDGVRFDALG